MLEESFKEMVILAKDDSDVMVYLLEILSPLIKSYIKKLFFFGTGGCPTRTNSSNN